MQHAAHSVQHAVDVVLGPPAAGNTAQLRAHVPRHGLECHPTKRHAHLHLNFCPLQETTLNSFNDAMGPIGVKVSAPEAGHPADSQWLVSDGRSLFRFTDGMARIFHTVSTSENKLSDLKSSMCHHAAC
jgi:hypothetical protein